MTEVRQKRGVACRDCHNLWTEAPALYRPLRDCLDLLELRPAGRKRLGELLHFAGPLRYVRERAAAELLMNNALHFEHSADALGSRTAIVTNPCTNQIVVRLTSDQSQITVVLRAAIQVRRYSN